MKRILKAAGALGVLVCALQGAEYYVSVAGSDRNPGTKERPFRNIQTAAEHMMAGDVCFIREGTYRETVRPKRSGQPGRPVRFAACPGEVVVMSGTEPVAGRWSVHQGSLYKTTVERDFIQLFVDGRMMIEARWPNMRFDQLWDRSRWASASTGSRYGRVVDPELAKTGIDWTGALATLNVAHQFLTWARPVARHSKGGGAFEYERDLPTITSYADRTKEWEDDRYYLSGKLEALDSPGEWFLDPATHTLYLWTEDGKHPGGRRVEFKARDYGFEVRDTDYIELDGIHFFGSTFHFARSNHSVVENCHLLFPTYSRHLTEHASKPEPSPRTSMTGSHNRISNSSLAYSSTGGFMMEGTGNVIENCLVRDICWNGSLSYVGIHMSAGAGGGKGSPSAVRRNTVFNTGNASINYTGQPYIIEYNHAWDGGRACKDVALIYTGNPQIAGSIVRYNWAHGCRTEEGHGLGIRGDDQTRELTVHHNVVWDTGRDGIIVKGDHNKVYNNTIFDIGTRARKGNYISLHTEPEPEKWWRKQFPLLPVQNANSLIVNNAAATITSGRKGEPFPAGPNVSHNFQRDDLDLRDPRNLDFRPRETSPLVDAGRAIPGLTGEYKGKAPDIGAYEYGGAYWRPGHRNRILAALEEDGKGGKRVRVRLSMPPAGAVTVTVSATGARWKTSPGSLEFSPEDWMRSQTVAASAPEAGAGASLRLEGEGLETAVVSMAPAVAETPTRARTAGGLYISWKEHLIDGQGVNGGVPIRGGDGLKMADFDRDGRMDIVSVHEDSHHIRLAFGTGNPREWQLATLAEGSEAGGAEDVSVADANGDGFPDIIAACEQAHLIYFQNPGKDVRSGRWPRVIPEVAQGRGSFIRVFFADLDGDGHPEVTAANKGEQLPQIGRRDPHPLKEHSWFRLPDAPLSGGWAEHVLGRVRVPINAEPVDLDGDGDIDVLGGSAGEGNIRWYENLGAGRFRERPISIIGRVSPVAPGHKHLGGMNVVFQDLNGDRRADIVLQEDDVSVCWLEAPADFEQPWRLHRIGDIAPDSSTGLALADINDDGRLDLITGGYSANPRDRDAEVVRVAGRLAWFEQPRNPAGPWIRHDISRTKRGMYDAFLPSDMDGDGDIDFVSTRGNSGIYDGVFWLEQVRTREARAAFQPARKVESAHLPLP